uniref:Uncharacterized protein n=1 Tax=Rhizophora mucronata TaxID=61149 RepID=A0A2P2PJV6_RHIMU
MLLEDAMSAICTDFILFCICNIYDCHSFVVCKALREESNMKFMGFFVRLI